MSTATVVTLFADFTCPFSFLTERALEQLADRHPLELRVHALELYPSPAPLPEPGHPPEELAAAAEGARELEISLNPPPARPRTRKAHEAARFAAARGLGAPMRAAIYDAYWREGADIGRIDLLMELARGLGMDATELKIALDIDLHREEVEQDADLAQRLGIEVVPTLYLGTGREARILVGAQGLRALDEALGAG